MSHRHSLYILCLLATLLIPGNALIAASPEEKLKELGIELPIPAKSIANYVGATRMGNVVFMSGHIPRKADGSLVVGKIGADLSVEDGYDAARLMRGRLTSNLEGGDWRPVQSEAHSQGIRYGQRYRLLHWALPSYQWLLRSTSRNIRRKGESMLERLADSARYH